MTRGVVELERVSRRFRVHPKPTRTVKDALLSLGRSATTDVWALQDVSLRVEPGEAVGLVGRNGSGKTTLLRLISGIIGPTSGRVAVGGRIGSLLELGAGFQPDFSGRENIFLNGSILGLRRATIREQLDEIVAFAELERFIDLPVRTYSSGMQMRLGFAIAAHLDADVLLLDEVFAVGDEEFQRKCFGKIFEFKQRGGTMLFVSHDATAVERLCDRAVLLRAGSVQFDGPAHGAVVEYHRMLADERDPEERGAGLREWGSGGAQIAEAQLVDADGAPRVQFLAGEPLGLRLRLVAARPLPAPRLSWELREDGGVLLASGAVDTETLGWTGGAGETNVRFVVDALPLAEGRFRLRLGLTDASGEHLLHQRDDAAAFVVIRSGETRGPVWLDGRWASEPVPAEVAPS